MKLAQLIKSCIKKNRGAQEELYNTYKKKLYPVCLKYCRSHAEAEDHMHDVFITIFESIKKYNGKGSFEGWMKRIAINKAIDNYKKNKTFELQYQKEISLSEDVSIVEEELPVSFNTIMSIIQELPQQYRIVFNLYELDGYPHKQIARMLAISESTSKSNLHRAKVILKEKIIAYNQKAIKIEKSHGS